MNRFFSALAVTATIAATSATFSPPSAHAVPGVVSDLAVRYLSDNWTSVIGNFWSTWRLQVFMTNLSWQETQAVQRQYRDRATTQLHNRCVDKVANTYYRGWQNVEMKTSLRWLIFMRVENGQANCYQSMPNWEANSFIRRRGW